MKKITALSTALLAATSICAFPGIASAATEKATECTGSLIERLTAKYGGGTVAELDIYFNGTTGVNCARMNHVGVTYGKKYFTMVYIGVCKETSPGPTCTITQNDSDEGNYTHYAGPVSVAARKHCIYVTAQLAYPTMANPRNLDTGDASHCG
ncbi:hypothetical protein AB5J62_18440 [Amycolatopsis sp. cg5]|uniref:hypothetical protein n=1 Tax=Amycolatopsis sp. cg5 TaxID=3238802 RepID=UPI003524B456